MNLNKKIEETRTKLQEISDELLAKKIEFGRETALINQ